MLVDFAEHGYHGFLTIKSLNHGIQQLEEMMYELSSNQRAYLRKLAHDLNPVVHIGKQGVTPALVQAIAVQLLAHELIKIKFGEFKDERKDLSQEIAGLTDSALVAVIGNVAIFFRPHPDRDKRVIRLPED